ncbi:Stealth CR1 domain-containing protein [Falsirhodobacter algicola]|uniref:Nitrate reductase n=1 Tax=Falsirhodobacter algicola TaxID=2692330 RepID=A0A8J8MTC6_9RHOB|nr:Stealth CR1 domain-containing protein [Falsirhodobacter algicola]QUS36129.1 nitrate reductase [Falsirhodobacter algicola]
MKIDAVVTWVDGDDPRHAEKRHQHDGRAVPAASRSATRFASRGEIGYCVWSILTFCPFIDRVFVVTDDQRPDVLEDLFARHPDWRARVIIADHRDIFGPHADLLPVFSSRSIETMLHRIPELAEHFLYFNDDIFIGRPCTAKAFFDGGRPVLTGTLRPFPRPAWARLKALLRRAPPRAGFKEAQQRAARLAGRSGSYLLAEHRPHPMRRSTLAAFYEGREEALRAQAGHRFRSPAQISPIGLAHHLELIAGAEVRPPVHGGYIKPVTGARRMRRVADTLDALRRGALETICIQSLDAMDPAQQRLVLEGLEAWMRDPPKDVSPPA